MTTLTTLYGLSPLVFLPGEGTERYRGVGVIVLFGLMCAATVTATFLPALSSCPDSWVRGVASKKAPQSRPSTVRRRPKTSCPARH